MKLTHKHVLWWKNLTLTAAAVLVLACGALSTPNTVNAAPADNNPDQTTANPNGNNPDADNQDGEDGDDGSVTCAIEKIGWILCPIMEGAGKMTDLAYGFLADNFLFVEPELFNNSNNGTRAAWESARNIANVMFVIAFLLLIYSQITGGLMSNYGIKKMLPRLIIGAIAVNMSYVICQGLVDLSNILGYNIMDAFKQWTDNLPKAMASTEGTHTTTPVSAMLVVLLAAGAVVWALMSFGGAIITMALVTIVTVIVILLLRKAFIVLLIVLSPIAFVAYLLPNTEKYYQKWMDMFIKLLMVFPIVALLLGAGQLASGIVLNAGVQRDADAATLTKADSTDCDEENQRQENGTVCGEPNFDTGKGQAPASVGLTAVGIAIAPLLFVWGVLKGALSAAGAIGGAIRGAVEKGTGNVAGYGKKAYDNTDLAKLRERNKAIADHEARAGHYSGYNPIKRGQSALNNKIVHSKNPALNKLGAYKGEHAKMLNQKDKEEASKQLLGDADGASLYTLAQDFGGGEDGLRRAATEMGMDWDSEIKNSGRLDTFNEMTANGAFGKAATYMAMAELMAQTGKGHATGIARAANLAAKRGATAGERSAMLEGSRGQLRKIGRADMLAEVNGAMTSGVPAAGSAGSVGSHYTDAGNLGSAFGEMENFSKDFFKQGETTNFGSYSDGSQRNLTANQAFYSEMAHKDRNTFEALLRARGGMSAKAQDYVDKELLHAANTNRIGGGTQFTTVQDMTNHFLRH